MPEDRQSPLRFNQVAALTNVRFDGASLTLVEQLDRAVEAATKHLGSKRGSKAEWQLKCKMSRISGDEVAVTFELTAKNSNIPPLPLKLYVDRWDCLVGDDPRQQQLPLEVVPPVTRSN